MDERLKTLTHNTTSQTDRVSESLVATENPELQIIQATVNSQQSALDTQAEEIRLETVIISHYSILRSMVMVKNAWLLYYLLF